MTTTTTIQPETRTLDVPGATLVYDLRPNEASTKPILFLIGGPMAAGGFVSLAGHFADRTVLTYDPRGSERSERADPNSDISPDIHADDLARVIDATGGGPVDLFATSGGAVHALALVAKHGPKVRLLVAHEPPLASQLPDRENAQAGARRIHETYMQRGWGAGMAEFIAFVSYDGEFPDDFADRPAPDPSTFNLPTEDDGSRNDPMLGQHMIATSQYEPDYEAFRAAPTRIILAVGEESGQTMAARGGYAVAERLGVEPVIFPSDHAGFLGGEYGQTGKPDEFAAKLREVVDTEA